MSLAGEAGLLQVSTINRLVVFVGDIACYESVFILPGDIKAWLMSTLTYKEAATSGIETVWIWMEVLWQRTEENNRA